MRLFIAINFNDELKGKLVETQNMLRKYALRGNFSSYDNLHLTLVFLGEVTDHIDLIKKAMDDITVSPFKLNIGGTGFFKRDRGDIWWAGIEESKSLILLQKQLGDDLLSKGFPIEKRRFVPHLTLAREVRLREGAAVPTPDMISADVTKISLMRSHRVGGVLTYTEIYAKKL